MAIPPVPPPPVDDDIDTWQGRIAEVRRILASGAPIDAMKALLKEMKRFAEDENIYRLNIDTRTFFSNPAEYGSSFKEIGGSDDAVLRFSSILAERGIVFSVLNQPARALQDLQAAVDLFSGHDTRVVNTLTTVKLQVRKALEEERRLEEARSVPIIILTGFLGSGKTTLLNYILSARHGKRYAVIENEVGQIGIDNQLLSGQEMAKRTTETITLLDNGCLCCTVRTDLVNAIKNILSHLDLQAANAQAAGEAIEGKAPAPPLDGIIIETTGLADPGPVCKTFFADDELRARTKIDGVLTVVDAVHFQQQLRRQRSEGSVNESAQQVAFADRLLLNKVDAVAAETIAEVETTIRSINEVCPIYRCSLATNPAGVPLDEVLGASSFSLDRVIADLDGEDVGSTAPPAKRARLKLTESFRPPSRHDTGIATMAVTLDGSPLNLGRFKQVMNSLRAEKALDLYRYKGVVCVREDNGALKRAVLQGVHDLCMFEARGDWPSSRQLLL